MAGLQIGDKAPNFTLPTDGNDSITLSGFKGRKVILYFYPKDDTPGCTKEACGFKENMTQLDKINAAVIGISKCSVAKHDKFKAKYNLNFPLASDEDGNVCEIYGTWAEKSMFGKKYMGIERTTFLIDEDGKIEKIWRKVKVNGHVDDVIAAIEKTKEEAA